MGYIMYYKSYPFKHFSHVALKNAQATLSMCCLNVTNECSKGWHFVHVSVVLNKELHCAFAKFFKRHSTLVVFDLSSSWIEPAVITLRFLKDFLLQANEKCKNVI